MQKGATITVNDSELGLVPGKVVGHNHEGYPLASFNGQPPVIVFPDMVVSSLDAYLETLSGVKRAKVRENLTHLQGVNGDYKPRHQHAERLAALPGVSIDREKGRVYTNGNGTFLEIPKLTKSLVDYLEWLLNR
jgi:hypothetical protein